MAEVEPKVRPTPTIVVRDVSAIRSISRIGRFDYGISAHNNDSVSSRSAFPNPSCATAARGILTVRRPWNPVTCFNHRLVASASVTAFGKPKKKSAPPAATDRDPSDRHGWNARAAERLSLANIGRRGTRKGFVDLRKPQSPALKGLMIDCHNILAVVHHRHLSRLLLHL